MSGKENPVIQQIILLFKEENYLGIIEKFRDAAFSSDKSAVPNLHLVTWPLPTEQDLQLFTEFVKYQNINHIYSIGCGTGLLEWLMCKFIEKNSSSASQVVGITGIEVDSRWWNSSYSPPAFLPLKFAGEDFDSTSQFGLSNDLAIFCYFNNIKIFLEYLKSFQGNFVTLIGPISTTQYCAPGPLELKENSKELPTNEWVLVAFKKFGFVNIDHIAIYQRKTSFKTSDKN